MNNQKSSPVVYFREFSDRDWDSYMGCETNPIIAECKNVTMDGQLYDIDIVIDLFTTLDDKQVERLGFHCYAKDYKKARSYVCMFQEAQFRTRKQLKQLAREVMSVNKLSVITFEANHFDVIEN